MRGIQHAEETFDAISDSLCDEQGFIVDQAGWDRHIVARDMSAWQHFQTVLLHGSAYLGQARQSVTRLNPDADTRRSWTHHLNALQTALDSARHQHDSWPAPGPFLGDDDRSREDLAAETWHEMIEWARHGPMVADILRRAGDLTDVTPSARRNAATLIHTGVAQSHHSTPRCAPRAPITGPAAADATCANPPGGRNART